MKKMFFMLLSLGLFVVNIEARCYIQPQYPGSGPAPDAYCWDIAYVLSPDQYTEGNGWEYTADRSSTLWDHGGDVYTAIEVFGYFDNTTADFNYQGMTLYYTEDLINQYNILIGKRYYYKKTGSNITSGSIRAKNYSTIEDQLYVK
jgi:hypothetical protein